MCDLALPCMGFFMVFNWIENCFKLNRKSRVQSEKNDLWPCRTYFGLVWPFMKLYGLALSYLAFYGLVWPILSCMAISSFIAKYWFDWTCIVITRWSWIQIHLAFFRLKYEPINQVFFVIVSGSESEVFGKLFGPQDNKCDPSDFVIFQNFGIHVAKFGTHLTNDGVVVRVGHFDSYIQDVLEISCFVFRFRKVERLRLDRRRSNMKSFSHIIFSKK